MATLYELQDRVRELAEELEHTDDLQLRAALIDELDALHVAVDDKIEAYCCVIKNFEAQEEMFRSELKRLKTVADRLSAARESMLQRMTALIEAGTAWSRGIHSLQWRKSRAVKVLDEKLIPTAYMREKLEYEPDKKQIMEDLKCGASIPGVTIEEKYNLTIK